MTSKVKLFGILNVHPSLLKCMCHGGIFAKKPTAYSCT